MAQDLDDVLWGACFELYDDVTGSNGLSEEAASFI
jgi:hypothetical protein